MFCLLSVFALHAGTMRIAFGIFTKDGRFMHEFKTTSESVTVSKPILYNL